MNEKQKIIAAVKKFVDVNKINVNTKTGFHGELCFTAGYISALIPDTDAASEDMKQLGSFVYLIHSSGRSLSTL